MLEDVLSKTVPSLIFLIGVVIALGVSLLYERYKK